MFAVTQTAVTILGLINTVFALYKKVKEVIRMRREKKKYHPKLAGVKSNTVAPAEADHGIIIHGKHSIYCWQQSHNWLLLFRFGREKSSCLCKLQSSNCR